MADEIIVNPEVIGSEKDRPLEMRPKGFSISEAIRFGWRTWKNNILFFLVIVLGYGILQALYSNPHHMDENGRRVSDATFWTFVWDLFIGILNVIYTMGIIKICLRFVYNQPVAYSDLWRPLPLFFYFLISSILYSIITGIGFVLLIIPSIIWGLMFIFFSYFIVDKKVGPITALSLSKKVTYGAKWDLLGLVLLNFLIFLAGILALGVGLFVALPINWLSMAYAYKTLVDQSPSLEIPRDIHSV